MKRISVGIWFKKYKIIEREHDIFPFDFVISSKPSLSDFKILGKAPGKKRKINVLSDIKHCNKDLKENVSVINYYPSN